MADWSNLKSAISEAIKENGNQEITGTVLQESLLNIISSLGENYQFAGIATPSTNPGTPDGNIFYLTTQTGTYTNFDNISISEPGLYILSYSNSSWTLSESIASSGNNDIIEYLARSIRYYDNNLLNKNTYIEGYLTASGTIHENASTQSYIIMFVPFLKDLSIWNPSTPAVYAAGFDVNGNVVTTTAMNTDTIEHVDGAVIAGLTYTLNNLDTAYVRYADETDNNGINAFALKPELTRDEIVIATNKDDISAAFTKTKNLFNKNSSDIITGNYINRAGAFIESVNYFVSPYIPFTEDMGKVFLSVNGTSSTPGTSPGGGGSIIVLYDNNFDVVTGYLYNEITEGVSWEEEVCYLRFSAPIAYIDTCQLEAGDAITEYINYDAFTPNFDIEIDNTIEPYSIEEEQLNIFDRNFYNPDDEDIAVGYYLNGNGVEIESENYRVTGYIRFTESLGKLTMIYLEGANVSGGACIVGFDENKNRVISYGQLTNNNGKIEWSTGVYYVRFSYYGSYTPFIYAGDTVPDLSLTYGEPKIKSIYLPEDDETKVTTNVMTLLGTDGESAAADTLSSGESLELENFPYYPKKGVSLSFYAKVTSFDTLLIGRGYEAYGGAWFEINNTNVTAQVYTSDASSFLNEAHSLTIEEFIKVILSWDDAGYISLIIQTKTGYYMGSTTGQLYTAMGLAFVTSQNSEFTDVKFNAVCRDFRCPVWMFGDSYFGIGSSQRWPTYLRNWGFINFYIAGLSGGSASQLYSDLQRALNFGTPKYILWCLGMNGSEDSSISYIETLASLCEDNNITLILATIPSVPDRDRETLREYVESSGYRYVDFYKAVGANSSGEWYDDYLSSDNVHPSVLGAQALASQVLIDFPEIMQYGFTVTNSTSQELIS